MPRGHRFHLDGQLCHITHRCHHKQFLLKFARDRRAWVRWLYESRKRFGLVVLNYQVTSNHVHLLVQDRGQGEVGRSMQLVAGCTGFAGIGTDERLGIAKHGFVTGGSIRSAEPLREGVTRE